ncbi:MAG: hypothetical protein ABGZ35_24315 [Planctomycetaceae bacterium]
MLRIQEIVAVVIEEAGDDPTPEALMAAAMDVMRAILEVHEDQKSSGDGALAPTW